MVHPYQRVEHKRRQERDTKLKERQAEECTCERRNMAIAKGQKYCYECGGWLPV